MNYAVQALEDLWDRFISGFCELGFVCGNGDPNMLGWLLMGSGAVILFVFVLIVLGLLWALLAN